MCIIIHKERGILPPTRDIIEASFASNPDGAGVGIIRSDAKTVEVQKGFMDVKSFEQFCKASVTVDDIAVYHFRIGTSGGMSPATCHPFPVSTSVADLRALSFRTRFAFIHNGVLSAGSKDLSDTQLYIRDTLAPRCITELDKTTIQTIEADTVGSRCVIMDGLRHKAIRTGAGWIQDKGLWYSNSSYLYTRAASWVTTYSSLDVPTCPVCGSPDTDCISYNNALFECNECLAVFQTPDNILLFGGENYVTAAY